MNQTWENILIEIGFFIILGVLYYFYQRRKIIQYEESKGPLIMGFILQSCLSEKKDEPEPHLDTLIEALDDYLLNKTPTPPISLLKVFKDSTVCSQELRDVINEGLLEYEGQDAAKK